MGSKKSRTKSRRSIFKRRKFIGNRFISEIEKDVSSTREERPRGNEVRPNADDEAGCSTPKRQKLACEDDMFQCGDEDDYYMFVNFKLLKKMVTSFCKCPSCGDVADMRNVAESRMGFATKLEVIYSSCSWKHQSFMSKECSQEGRATRSPFEVNLRVVAAFREIGKGHSGIENFCRCMNMNGISQTGYRKLKLKLAEAYEADADASMQFAASEVRASGGEQIQGNTVCQCSLDGSWQKRGHSSLNGLVTAISNGKCIDTKVFSKKCKACERWESRKGTDTYEQWKLSHYCKINHQRSSGAMEAAGASEIFCSSVAKHKLIYKDYIGDGDTSSFKEVVDAKPYIEFGIIPNKLECIGHIQKRLGNRLRLLRKQCKNTSTSLSGRGKLTDKMINSLQNNFGLAIRQNQGELYAMKKAIGAILWHSTEFQNVYYRHRFCPQGKDSWCKWQKSKSLVGFKFKEKQGMPLWIHDLLKPVFQDLSKDELLSKCLHGKMQNCNEALNNIIWTKCPKNVFVERKVLEMGVHSAILEFNEGPKGFYKVLNKFDMEPGIFTEQSSSRKVAKKIRNTVKKQSDFVKKRRKHLRGIRKGFIDMEKEQEGGKSYVPGKFS